jgi:hypothetical protein
LSKSPKDVLGVEFANFKIGRAAECYRTCMAKSFPKPLRTLYRGCGTRTSKRFTSDDAAIDVIERHDHELGNFGHTPFLPNTAQRQPRRRHFGLFSLMNAALHILIQITGCAWHYLRYTKVTYSKAANAAVGDLSSLQLQYARPFTNSPINDGLVAFF